MNNREDRPPAKKINTELAHKRTEYLNLAGTRKYEHVMMKRKI